MKKVLKYLGILILVVIIGGVILGMMANEAKPVGQPSAEADALAQKMMNAVDIAAWDSTHIIQWTFKGMHDFLWDKKNNNVRVTWEDSEVLLHTKSVTGKAFIGGQEVMDEAQKGEMVQSAWGFFCNDSWWLNAVVKANDAGTERSIVTLEDGREGLMVSYSSGGVTPGDAYVWILDENGMPTSYKMWVSIIPIGGMEFTWEAWETLPTGAKIATLHKSKILELDISNLKSGDDWSAFGLEGNPFDGM
ncbi:hypothetical protein OAF63_00115 [Saprospiraceae bacterium]|jgi:hypothetical protein|nr:hypothetical protein [Bacteroidota bacterium]MDB4727164.1 hypothetical protein [Saprospiraceae bacterium]MDF1863400.1 hypothetical protein [Saprospiraceae bacterium]